MKISNLILRIFVNTDLQKDILFLKGIEFFGELNVLQLKKIRSHIYKKIYMKGEVIYKKGEEATLFCIVRSGKIEMDDNGNKQIAQKRALIGKKYAFNDNEVYSNTATALEDSELFLIHKNDIELLMEKDKSIGFNMFKQISKMIYKRAQNER